MASLDKPFATTPVTESDAFIRRSRQLIMYRLSANDLSALAYMIFINTYRN